jgi:hypothetical protein
VPETKRYNSCTPASPTHRLETAGRYRRNNQIFCSFHLPRLNSTMLTAAMKHSATTMET